MNKLFIVSLAFLAQSMMPLLASADSASEPQLQEMDIVTFKTGVDTSKYSSRCFNYSGSETYELVQTIGNDENTMSYLLRDTKNGGMSWESSRVIQVNESKKTAKLEILDEEKFELERKLCFLSTGHISKTPLLQLSHRISKEEVMLRDVNSEVYVIAPLSEITFVRHVWETK